MEHEEHEHTRLHERITGLEGRFNVSEREVAVRLAEMSGIHLPCMVLAAWA